MALIKGPGFCLIKKNEKQYLISKYLIKEKINMTRKRNLMFLIFSNL